MSPDSVRPTNRGFLNLDRKLKLQFLGFIFAGGIGLLIDLSLFNALLTFGFPAQFANVIGLIFGTVANFLVNARVFRTSGLRGLALFQAVRRYAVVGLGSFAYAVVGFNIIVETFSLESSLSLNLVKVFLIGSGAIARFALSRFWIFAPTPG